MKKSQLDHVLRAAREITGESRFIIIGSQSLHGKGIDVDALFASMEADLYVPGSEVKTELLNSIGEGSRFHETYGYYADPVDEGTAILPKGWKARLVNLPPGDTQGAKGLCLDPHDMAVSKYLAGREKDLDLLEKLVRLRLLEKALLLKRLQETPVDEPRKSLAKARIERHFKEAKSSRPPSPGNA
jgi:hypothetical protein